MNSISESGPTRTEFDLSPWHAVDACHLCQKMLDEYFRWGAAAYTPTNELAYRNLRDLALGLIKNEPCFARITIPDGVLPSTLAHYEDESWWEFVGERQGLRFQSELVSALLAAGIERAPNLRSLLKSGSARSDPQPIRPRAPSTTSDDARTTLRRAAGDETGKEIAKRPGARGPGRPRKVISATLISKVFWGMKDERLGTPDAKYDPSQDDVCERLAALGQAVSPKIMMRNLEEAGMSWPPPRLPADGSFDDA